MYWFFKNKNRILNVVVVDFKHQWLIIVVIRHYNRFDEKLIRARNQIIEIDINLNVKSSKKSSFNEIIYFFDWVVKKNSSVFDSSLSKNLTKFRLNYHFFIVFKFYKIWVNKQQKTIEKKNSRFDKKNEFSIFFSLMFVNESKFVVFVFLSLDSLLRNSRRFNFFLITLSLSWSFNTTSKSMFTTTTFITSSIFDISRKSNVSSIFDFLLTIVENSIVSSNIQYLKFFNFIFSRKISTRLSFFSIVRRSKIEIKKTRNIRDTMNDVFTNNVFDSRINDFDIIIQTKNILSKIIESTTNQNKQNNSTNQFFNFDERFN